MTERVIDTATVQLSQNDLQISAYLAKPSAPGSYPGVVVLQEIFGVNDHIREVTERIALEGYVAMSDDKSLRAYAPALFQRNAPGFESGYTNQDIEIGRTYAMQTNASELLSDLQLSINTSKLLEK